MYLIYVDTNAGNNNFARFTLGAKQDAKPQKAIRQRNAAVIDAICETRSRSEEGRKKGRMGRWQRKYTVDRHCQVAVKLEQPLIPHFPSKQKKVGLTWGVCYSFSTSLQRLKVGISAPSFDFLAADRTGLTDDHIWNSTESFNAI